MKDAIADRRKEGEGLVFSIQRYSIHDGPGIRTTVFFKGCPLRCRWCSNPESISPHPELIFRPGRCDGCGRCIPVCAPSAIAKRDGCVHLDRDKCDLCFKCMEACFTEALEVSGRFYGLDEILNECLKDEPFYSNSGGGVTLSGGEPLYQPSFAVNLLRSCREHGVNTALDTCGHVRWEVMEEALPYTDLVMYDVKHMDPERHRGGTGVTNELVLENLQRLSLQKKNRIWVRVPVVPGFNDSPDNIEKTARMAAGLGVEKMSLLTYHEWGKPKYDAIGREYSIENASPPSKEKMEELASIASRAGVEVTVDY